MSSGTPHPRNPWLVFASYRKVETCIAKDWAEAFNNVSLKKATHTANRAPCRTSALHSVTGRQDMSVHKKHRSHATMCIATKLSALSMRCNEVGYANKRGVALPSAKEIFLTCLFAKFTSAVFPALR